ncbi:MAG: hypothetical protein ABW203_03225 [Novosphingobium sp.]
MSEPAIAIVVNAFVTLPRLRYVAAMSAPGRHPLRRAVRHRAALRWLREFLIAYCACFLAVSAFIA